MTDLIKRLKEAEAGSRELDLAIWSSQGFIGTLGEKMGCVTTSLDAALALAERVLPPDPAFHPQTPSVGWKINLYRGMIPTDQKGGWFANVRRHATDGFQGASTNPALALCIAILKATDTGREA